MEGIMAPEWAAHWTISEAACLLLDAFPDLMLQLPYDCLNYNKGLDIIWESLSEDCRSTLEKKRLEFDS